MTEELRNLMHSYVDRHEKLLGEYMDAEEAEDEELKGISKLLLRQCRTMIAELWQVMVKVGALDEEEIEFGSIKVRTELTTAQRLMKHMDGNAKGYYKGITDKHK